MKSDENVILCRFRRVNWSKFYSGMSPEVSGLELAKRPGGSPSVVLVDDTKIGKDWRLKAWLDPGGEKTLSVRVNECGDLVLLEHVRDNLYQGYLSESQGADIRSWTPVYEDEDELNGRGMLDQCFETEFREVEGEWRLHGNVSDLPEWMGAQSISITRNGRGGGDNLQIDLDDPRAGQRLLAIQQLRVNGVWLFGQPAYSKAGRSWWYAITPGDAMTIRDADDALSLEDVIPPPRSRAAVRRVCVWMRDNGQKSRAYDAYDAWTNAANHVAYGGWGISICWGQMLMHERSEREARNKEDFYRSTLQRRYKTRGAAYAEYTLPDWAAEVGGKPGEWTRKMSAAADWASAEKERKCLYRDKYEAALAKYDEALEVCEGFEERFAEAIRIEHMERMNNG